MYTDGLPGIVSACKKNVCVWVRHCILAIKRLSYSQSPESGWLPLVPFRPNWIFAGVSTTVGLKYI